MSLWVDEADQLLGDVDWPFDALGIYIAVFNSVYSDPPGAQGRSVIVAKVRSALMEQLRKVGGVVCHLSAQVMPELDVLVESGREIGQL